MPIAAISSQKLNTDPAGLVGVVTKAVNAEIRERGLKPGDALPGEAAIAVRLGVSRGVVREALRSLAALHVVDIANGRRPRVSAIDYSVLALMVEHAVETSQITVQQTLDVRRAIELRSVVLAALRRSDMQAEDIAASARAMRASAGGSAQMTAHDIAFHVAIASAAHNPMFALLMTAFKGVMERTCPIGWFARTTDRERMEVLDLHDAIAKAIRDRDAAAAERAMAAHFDCSVKALVAAGIT